ncbi:MAG TPA: ATP-binding cassette domain-containing protein [Arachidicoccus sp.]|nr:ATP-binding cassette domain-containing protein [Arachidicoccus sp.]
MSTSVLSIQHLSKRYGAIRALKDVSFEVPKGSIFGILGPNGSGKTTLLGIITDVLRQDSGQFALFEAPPDAATRRRIGTLLETPNFYPYLSARKNLEITAAIKQIPVPEIDEVLKRVDLFDRQNSKFSTFSLGMKQRLAIGAALLGEPEMLILDEPTNGLDPNGIAEIRHLIQQLAAEGKTIIMASHLLDEVEKVCTHVAIIKNGDLLATGGVGEVLASEDQIALGAADLAALEVLLKGFGGYISQARQGDRILMNADLTRHSLADLNNFCFENGIVLNHLALHKKSLEAKFLEITH